LRQGEGWLLASGVAASLGQTKPEVLRQTDALPRQRRDHDRELRPLRLVETAGTAPPKASSFQPAPSCEFQLDLNTLNNQPPVRSKIMDVVL
jgi:hypothetical protein